MYIHEFGKHRKCIGDLIVIHLSNLAKNKRNEITQRGKKRESKMVNPKTINQPEIQAGSTLHKKVPV